MLNENLSKARKAKNDEFYTRYIDIQREINAYLEFDPDIFRGKTILLPCDDPEWSNFTKFFAQNFEKFGLKKLISTSYARATKRQKYGIPEYHQISIFEQESDLFDAQLSDARGRIFTLERKKGTTRKININDLKWKYMEGDGDFRSDEVKKLRSEADIIITNPPFSLYKEFITWLFEDNKKFLIIGNKNSVTYKEVFFRIKDNLMWSGATGWGGGLWFEVTDQSNADKTVDGIPLANVSSVWFTNMDHGRRHQPLSLMTMNDNIKYSKHKDIKGIGYHEYDNYPAIDVPYTDSIPSDYDGEMGVPVTFLEKYCPEQFVIIGSFNNSNIETKQDEHYVLSTNTPTMISGKEKLWNGPVINKQPIYKRIVIRRITDDSKS